MAFARPKPDANSEDIAQRYTEYSDVIRARNKREDRLLDVRLKFYEREKKIRLNIIRKQQSQLERVRISLSKEAKKIQDQKQNIPLPSWMPSRPQFEDFLLIPETIITDFDSNLNLTQSELMFPSTTEPTRRHSAR